MIKINNYDSICNYIEKVILAPKPEDDHDIKLGLLNARFKVQILLREKDGHKFSGAVSQRFLTLAQLRKKKSSLIKEAERRNGRLSINLSPINWIEMTTQYSIILQQKVAALSKKLRQHPEKGLILEAEKIEQIIGNMLDIPCELSSADRKTKDNDEAKNRVIQTANSLKKLVPGKDTESDLKRLEIAKKILGNTSELALQTSTRKNPTHIRNHALEMLDIDDPMLLDKAIEIFSEMSGVNKDDFFIVPSKSGYHAIFSSNYNLANVKISENFKGRKYTYGDGRQVFELKPDAETILYYNDTKPFESMKEMYDYIKEKVWNPKNNGFLLYNYDGLIHLLCPFSKRVRTFFEVVPKDYLDSIIEKELKLD